jgi:hypothetical protein
MFRFFEEQLCAFAIGAGESFQVSVRYKPRKVRSAFDALQCAFDIALKPPPVQFGSESDHAKCEDETVGHRGTQ